MEDFTLSLMMLVAFGLVVGGIALWRRDGFVRHVWLMFVAAAVILANVVIWAAPIDSRAAPAEHSDSGSG